MAKKRMGVAVRGTSEREGKAWGKGEYANMPQDVVKEMYPKTKGGSRKTLDDTIKGIDYSIDRSEGRASKYVSDQH